MRYTSDDGVGADIERLFMHDWGRSVPVAGATSWSGLVEEIAELEELLADLAEDPDLGASTLTVRLQRLLDDKRRALRSADVG